MWSIQMPETKDDKTPKRVDRFIYSQEDVKHIFRLGDIGGVFSKRDENTVILLKKLLNNTKK